MSKDKENTKVAEEEQTSEEKEVLEEDTEEQNTDADETSNSEGETSEDVPEIDWQDKYVRLHAEWDNYRKRMDEQRADERIRATERLMSDLLVCVDDMQRSIDYATEHGEGDLLDGIKAVYQKFTGLLAQHGLEEIDPSGEQFDPLTAQAVGTVEDDSVFEETVRDVYQKGYKLGVKVLRPAMVTYTTGGKKRPQEQTEEEEEAVEETNTDSKVEKE